MNRNARSNKARTAMMGFTELSTTDSGATKEFLEQAFRWKFDEIQMPGGKYLSYRSPDGETLGIRTVQHSEAPISMNYVRVADLEIAQNKIRELGGEIVLQRTDIPNMGSFFWFRVPSGPIMACWQDAPRE